MESSRPGRFPGAALFLLLLPGILTAQLPGSVPVPRIEVVRMTFRGVNVVKQKELANSLATDASHCVSAILIPICWMTQANYVYERRFLNRQELARDILRARVFYWKRGYRETEVDTVVTPRGNRKVEVTFVVNEGPPTMIRDITVTQTNPVLTEPEIARRMVLGENSPLNMIRLDSSLIFLQQSLWNKGYADAIVDTTITLDGEARTAAVEISIDPRWIATISDIIVEGNDAISTRTILNSITLHPGSLFRRSDLLSSQRALYESRLFRRAALEVPRQGDSSKVVVITVREAPLREARISAGFTTIDFVQVEGRFTHYNFMGGARRLEAQGAIGNLLASSLNGNLIFRDAFGNVRGDDTPYTKPTYNASLNLRQPWFMARENEVSLGVFTHRRTAPGIYVDRGFGTSATFTRDLTERAPLSLTYRYEINKVEAGDVYFCVNYGICDAPTLTSLRANRRLSPLALTLSIDRADDPFSPRRGYRANGDLEHASSFTISDFRHNRVAAEAAAYFPVRKRGALAGHIRLGWVEPLESTSEAVGSPGQGDVLHPRKRFYAGGSRSVRGYGENQLGPRVLSISPEELREHDSTCVDIRTCDPNAPGLGRLDFEPRALGGNVVAEASAELRFPAWRAVYGAVFVDAGYVSQRTNPELPRSGAAITPGFGVRYRSPVGPIRVDIGINPGLSETLPVVTEDTVGGERRLVRLEQRRRFTHVRSGLRGIMDRMVLHLSIGEAF